MDERHTTARRTEIASTAATIPRVPDHPPTTTFPLRRRGTEEARASSECGGARGCDERRGREHSTVRSRKGYSRGVAQSAHAMLRKALIALLSLVFVFLLISISRRTVQEEKDVERVHEITHRVYLDVDIDGQHAGRIVIGLYGVIVPKTVENFRSLCTGEKGKGGHGKALHYKGTPFHRIVSGFVIQGGDVTYGDGRGSDSIYGGTFPDENFIVKHSHAGVVSMVNSGPDSNGSQFFITSVKASWLDGEHVAFGKVLQGMDTVYAIEGGAGTYNGKPRKKVIIVDSGEISRERWEEES